MRPVLAIIRLTLWTLLRSRFLAVTLLLLFGVTALLPFVLQDDGTAVGRARVWIQYQFHSVLLILSIAMLVAGPGLVAGERERRYLQQMIVKPVSFAAIWLGKWLALAIVSGGILGVVGLLFLAAMRLSFSADRLGTHASDVNDRVWTVRRAIRPERGSQWVSPNEMGEWCFSMPAVPAGHPLLLRTRFFSAAVLTRWTVPGEWDIRSPDGTLLFRQRTDLRPGAIQEIALPPLDRPVPAGVWTVRYRNPDADTLLFDEEIGLTLWSPAGGFAANLVRAGLLAWFRLLLLAAAGLAMGSLFSPPVAVFMASFLLALIGFSGQIGWVVKTGQLVEPPHAHGDEPVHVHRPSPARKRVERTLLGMYRLLYRAVSVLHDYDPVGRTAESTRIEVGDLTRGLWQMVLLRGGVLAGLSVIAAARREWG